jgi:hypothetical protein
VRGKSFPYSCSRESTCLVRIEGLSGFTRRGRDFQERFGNVGTRNEYMSPHFPHNSLQALRRGARLCAPILDVSMFRVGAQHAAPLRSRFGRHGQTRLSVLVSICEGHGQSHDGIVRGTHTVISFYFRDSCFKLILHFRKHGITEMSENTEWSLSVSP